MSKGKAKKKQRNVDWAADPNFSENRVMVYIEHTEECPIFRIKAIEVGAFLQSQLPEKMVQLVRNKAGKQEPRPGSFEISFSQNARTSVHDLWSGIDKGPPRREKVPADFNTLMPEVTRIMKKIYVAVPVKVEDDIQDRDASDM